MVNWVWMGLYHAAPKARIPEPQLRGTIGTGFRRVQTLHAICGPERAESRPADPASIYQQSRKSFGEKIRWIC
jgi:hypothetical protein